MSAFKPGAVIRLLTGAAVFVAAYWLLLFVLQRSVIFPAPSGGGPPRPSDAQQVWLKTPAGQIEAWFLAPRTSASRPVPLILFAHGNAELIDYWALAFSEPRDWGMAVLLVEYPGYGRSAGSPSEETIGRTFEAAYDWAKAQASIDTGRVVLYGRSLGGGAVAALSLTRPAAALVLESSFTTTGALALRFLAPPFLVRDRFDNLNAVSHFGGPKLILHGDHDEVIPTSHGRRLAAAAGVPLELLPCGHNDCERPWPQVHRFLIQAGILPRSSAAAT